MLIALLQATVYCYDPDFCSKAEWSAIKDCYDLISSKKLNIERRHAGSQRNEAETIRISSGKLAVIPGDCAVELCPEPASRRTIQCNCTTCQLQRTFDKSSPTIPRHKYAAACLYAYRLWTRCVEHAQAGLDGLRRRILGQGIGSLNRRETRLVKVLLLVHKHALDLGMLSTPLLNMTAIAVFNLTTSDYLKTDEERYSVCYTPGKTFGLFNLGPDQFSELNSYSVIKQSLVTENRPYYLNIIADNIVKYQIQYFKGIVGCTNSIIAALDKMPDLRGPASRADFLQFYDIFLAVIKLSRA
ncbi:hypothetical protein PAPHI01_1482 [Pancytospora philotis]|nr:hypothetical protein PAPHI01_1482 [Pancytospora philotis]